MKDLNCLRARWTVDDIDGVGRAIHEAVPGADGPEWAASVLSYVAGDELLCDELRASAASYAVNLVPPIRTRISTGP